MREYKELLATVSEMESAAPKPMVNYVQMELESAEPVSVGAPRSYSQLLGEVARADGGLMSSKQKKPQPILMVPKLTPTPTERVTKKIKEPSAAAAPKKGWSMPSRHKLDLQVEAAASPTLQPPQIMRPQKVQPKPLERSAEEELAKTIKASAIETPRPVQQVYQPPKDLVLPTLSLTDQVAELDKILENVQQRRFNSAQMAIVKMEVKGLSEMISSQPESLSSPTPFDQDLRDLRRARLAEILALIRGS